jgi:hypothetical protein
MSGIPKSRWCAMMIVCAGLFGRAAAQPVADAWITHPDAPATPIVLRFERVLTIEELPGSLPVAVTADNRFVLEVNGARVASGPSTGTLSAWRVAAIDLAPNLKRGDNVISAVVWNFGELAPAAQQSVATGFRLLGAGLSTGESGWRVRIEAGHSAASGREQIPWTYYVASTPEIIDATKPPGEWCEPVPAPAAAARTLIEDPLPHQLYVRAAPGRVVRSSIPEGQGFPASPITIPARTEAKLLLRRDAMISAYPLLQVEGGRGARIRLQYGEALYDAEGRKGDRDLVGERQLRGFHDEFVAAGDNRAFAPLWWRTFRYLEISVHTDDSPLVLRGLELRETGYPFRQHASFRSDDAALNRIWDIGWRTLRVDAHETYMDSSYWEQLQYTGDTRLQMLISYAVSGDARLARQAIDAFAGSDVDGGVMQGAWPSRLDNVIATFSLAWIGMLSDWLAEQPDAAIVRRHVPRMRRVLAWFERYRNATGEAAGLLGKSPHWNFIDWSGQRWDDRDTFPSWGKDNGSCLTTAMWVGALRQAAGIETRVGDAGQAAAHRERAARASDAIRRLCWDPARGLYADDTDRAVFSQHMNVFAVLYDIAPRTEMRGLLERITVQGRGIDAPRGLYASTYYFAWYLARAFEHAGMADRYVELLQSWRDLLPMNFTTWPETRHDPRSDTHAWSAHPTADLLRIVAGIGPDDTGYASLRIEPRLGALTSLDATAMTPAGPVTVVYRIAGGVLRARVERPTNLRGEFWWRGKAYPLPKPVTELELAAD